MKYLLTIAACLLLASPVVAAEAVQPTPKPTPKPVAKPAPRPSYRPTLLLVPKTLQDAANAAAIEAAGPYAADTFNVPVIIGGGQQVTHYAASWRMTKTQLKAFKAAMTGQQNTVAELARGETPRGKLAELGAKRRPEQGVAPGPGPGPEKQ